MHRLLLQGLSLHSSVKVPALHQLGPFSWDLVLRSGEFEPAGTKNQAATLSTAVEMGLGEHLPIDSRTQAAPDSLLVVSSKGNTKSLGRKSNQLSSPCYLDQNQQNEQISIRMYCVGECLNLQKFVLLLRVCLKIGYPTSISHPPLKANPPRFRTKPKSIVFLHLHHHHHHHHHLPILSCGLRSHALQRQPWLHGRFLKWRIHWDQ